MSIVMKLSGRLYTAHF